MIHRSPAEYYIKYLMLLPSKLSDEDIVRTLREKQLDYPGKGYLQRLRLTLRPPIPFYPTIETDIEAYRFLQQQRVHRLFFRDKHVEMALSLLHHPRAKEIVESLILVADCMPVILDRLRRFGFFVTKKAVEYYKHFFLNVDLVDPTEMRALISIRVDDMMLESDDKESLIRFAAMKKALYNDPRYMAVNSANSKTAQMRLQMRHDLVPNRVDYGRMAETVRIAATTAAYEAINSGGPHAAQNARDFSVVAANMDAMLRERGDGDDKLRKTLVALGTDAEEVLTVKQLTAGNFTDCVDPVVEEKEKGNAK